MPIGCMGRGEGPDKGFTAEATLDMGIFCDVHRIVEINKIMILNLPVANQGNYQQAQTIRDENL